MTDRMKILCIGKSGQVAQALAERTAFAGVDCVCLGRPELDLLSVENIEAAFGDTHPTIVVNAAAYTNVDGAESDQATAFAVNADAVGQLAEHCANRGLPLVHLSTDYVFDGEKKKGYSPSDKPNPINEYGKSKLLGEQYIQQIVRQVRL